MKINKLLTLLKLSSITLHIVLSMVNTVCLMAFCHVICENVPYGWTVLF